MVRQRDEEVVPGAAAEAESSILTAERIDNPFRPTATQWYGRKAARRLVALAIGVLLLGDIWAFRDVANRTDPVSVGDAVARYRDAQVRGGNLGPRLGGAATTTALPAGGADSAVVSSIQGGGPPSSAAATRVADPAPPAADPGAGPTDGAAAAAGPAPGVYVYDTTGSESVTVLGGSSHTYPSQSTITLTDTPCGYNLRWAPLEQRFDQWEMCTHGTAVEETTLTVHHEFYGQSDERRYTCRGVYYRIQGDEPGASAKGQCSTANSDARMDVTSTVIGIEQIVVGGQPVAAVHVHSDELMTGVTQGTKTLETWFAVSGGQLVRRTADIEADSSTVIGNTHYSEHLTLNLTSLAPLQ